LQQTEWVDENHWLLLRFPYLSAMFSFRRKPKKEPQPKQIKPSPSLPELSSTGIPWPEDLVDIAAIQQSPASEDYQSSLSGAPKTPSLKTSEHGPIPFHKPFRTTLGSGDAGAISSIYMNSGTPAQFEPKTPKAKTATQKGNPKYSQRRARVPPTFNLMVCPPASACEHGPDRPSGSWSERNWQNLTPALTPGNCRRLSNSDSRPEDCA
jgi:hypothetical protein